MHYATPKQVSYIDALMDERVTQGIDMPTMLRLDAIKVRQAPGLSTSEASRLITTLRQCPVKVGAMAKEGYYVKDGNVYVVVENRSKTATYAKRMVVSGGRGKWVYAPGVGRNIAHEGLVPLTKAEAARLGRLHGVCMVCGRPLTDPDSVERGIGPVCATKV